MGNLRSVSKALERLGAQVRLTSRPEDVASAEKLILPGVGAFDAAMRELDARGLTEPIKTAIAANRPYLGICLGLQLLFDSSEEGQGVPGLGILRGTVKRLPAQADLKIPHMGWNQVSRPETADQRPEMLNDIPEGSFFYFVHSYYADPADRSLVALESEYGLRFPAMIARERLFATQFHPEKSQAVGLRLLKNFVELASDDPHSGD